ncbi:MAG: hypothetical protein CVU59_03645 [Deltaproteobacteria bacterium HGW-Deltaproteobacteria-17]|nr:MAG: hypothetical protein CVU59_03645 [Deltaproteobacteria bacterium HGW-Deltaproteobacteria-17]
MKILSCALVLLAFTLLSACDTKTKSVARCGDDFLDPGEQCDGEIVGITCGDLGHYNVNGALSCRSDCTYNLTDCGGSCGDGVIELNFNEACDTDNLGGATCESLGFRAGTLTCGSECQFDTSQCESTCGNGTLDAWELCDGAQLGGASCQSLGYSGGALTCKSDCTYDEQNCQTVCGNAVLETGEECDGNKLRGLTCESLGYESGTLACSAGCTLDRTACAGSSSCGNGAIDAPETCDGENLGGATCVTAGYEGGSLSCGLDCRFNYSRCVGATCGNGTLDNGEVCEPGLAFSTTCRDLGFLGGTLSCSSSCQWNTLGCNNIDLCGNNTADPGEACDGTAMNNRTCATEGFYTGTASCNADCTVNTSACSGRCGDGTLDAGHGEACDGDQLGANSCTTEGFYEGTLACDDTCTLDTTGCTGRCGDGTLDAAFGEACDGTDFGGRVCYSGSFSCLGNCQINDFNCAGYCGDGTIQSGFEECDGANFDTATKPCGELGFAGGTRTCDVATCTPQYNCLTWVKVEGSYLHHCALDSAGGFWCWGTNTYGQLGDGTTTNRDRPTRVLGPSGMGYLTDVVDFNTSDGHTCAKQSSGALWCWGFNNYGQLGDGTTNNASTPVRVRGAGGTGYLADVSKIALGALMTCVVKTDGTAWCWGGNELNYQHCLGVNSSAPNLVYPTQVVGVNGVGFLQNVVQIALMRSANTNVAECSAKAIVGASRAVVTWGSNYQGNPSTTATGYPVAVLDVGGIPLEGIAELGEASGQSCAIRNNGRVICWGQLYKGDGNGQQVNSSPVTVLNSDGSGYLLNATKIFAWASAYNSTYSNATCVLNTSGEVFCWGDNDGAYLGLGHNTSPVLRPTQMQGTLGAGVISGVQQITHFCLLKTDGSLNCWAGDHQGQAGDGSNSYGHAGNVILFPVPVLGSAP